MPIWGFARDEGRNAAQRQLARQDRERSGTYVPAFAAATGRCFLCGERRKLRTGSIAGTAVLWCPACEPHYRSLVATL